MLVEAGSPLAYALMFLLGSIAVPLLSLAMGVVRRGYEPRTASFYVGLGLLVGGPVGLLVGWDVWR